MRRPLVNWTGLTGVAALVSYAAAVMLVPRAYPGYDWMRQAVSDLSVETAPSRMLRSQLAAPYGVCSVVCATCAAVVVSERKAAPAFLRRGICLFALMRWVSKLGYDLFPLSEAGTGVVAFQDVMHVYVVTAAVVLLSLASLGSLVVAGRQDRSVRTLGHCAAVGLAMMIAGALGQAVIPPTHFGVVERLSVFAAVGFDTALGIWLLWAA